MRGVIMAADRAVSPTRCVREVSRSALSLLQDPSRDKGTRKRQWKVQSATIEIKSHLGLQNTIAGELDEICFVIG